MMWCLLVFFSCALHAKFVVITPTYNNEQWCIQNVASVLAQRNIDWEMHIIDDMSTDNTVQRVGEYCTADANSHRVFIHQNSEKKYALRNIYEAVHQFCEADDIVVLLDGDDWLAHPYVLQRVAHEYEYYDAWLTYGQYIDYPHNTLGHCSVYPQEILARRAFREHQWLASHLRTFKAGLFKKIKKEDFLYQDGDWGRVTWDMAIMFPLLEMAGEEHIRFIPDVLYIYNHHEKNDYRQALAAVLACDALLRAMPKYEKEESL